MLATISTARAFRRVGQDTNSRSMQPTQSPSAWHTDSGPHLGSVTHAPHWVALGTQAEGVEDAVLEAEPALAIRAVSLDEVFV